jgi:hypothetical protein
MQQNEGGFVALQQNVIGSPCRRFAGHGNLVLASLLHRG